MLWKRVPLTLSIFCGLQERLCLLVASTSVDSGMLVVPVRLMLLVQLRAWTTQCMILVAGLKQT